MESVNLIAIRDRSGCSLTIRPLNYSPKDGTNISSDDSDTPIFENTSCRRADVMAVSGMRS
jgi:hypothetical protein